MKTHTFLMLISIACLTFCPSLLTAQDNEKTAPAASSDFRALQVKLAETRLQLAEMELKLATDQNRRDDGLVPLVVLESLELSLAKAKAQLATANGDEKAAREAMSASADATVKVARSRFARLKEYAEKSGTVSKEDLQRAQMRLTIAELERDSLKSLLDEPLEQQLRWHVERINAMIDGLSDRVIVLEDKR